jgi:hypothetical protein
MDIRIYRLAALVAAAVATLGAQGPAPAADDPIVQMLRNDRPYHSVSGAVFEQLGWPLPDDGLTVKALADAAPGGAFDPRLLESAPADKLGYRAKWQVVRYKLYGLEWDIPALHLIPNNAVSNLPTLAIINGGSANWYEFFLDPLNRPGLGQYLAQRVPVLLITIPGNYRHGGWTGKSYEKRIPGYLLDRDVSPEEARIRHSIYTFKVVTEGVMRLIETVTTGPIVIIGHSTGGEVQFILSQSRLKERLQGLSLGWGTGGPAALNRMRAFRGEREAGDYPPVWELNPRPPSAYSGGYLGPLNPVWDPARTRLETATRWMDLEDRRRPQFKQTLQNVEHNSADNLRDHIAAQIRAALKGNNLGVNADEVIADLFTTMRAPVTGYRRMIWTVAALDDGHWNREPSNARELQVANEFRAANPRTPVRVLLFDLPMTHYGHIEKPRQLAGGLTAALTWLAR